MKNKNIKIELNITDRKMLFSKYNSEVISSELKTFLENRLIGENVNSKVTIVIKSNKISKDDKKLFETILKKEYGEQINDINILSGEENLKKYILFFLGIIFITCSYVIDSTISHIVAQVLLVFGWVALWEVASTILFSDNQHLIKLKRAKQLKNSIIKFEED